MRKSLLVLAAIFALVMFAVPAMAEVNLSGFIRVNSIASNYERYDAGQILPLKTDVGSAETFVSVAAPFQARLLLINTNASTAAYLEERGRLRFEAKGENVGAVAFFEIDMRFGDSQYAVNRNQGGGLEADSINLETKNLYIWFKPSANHTINVGLQNFTDSFRGVLFGAADFAGIVGTAKLEPIDIRYGYAKLKDAAAAGTLINQDKNNDTDLWLLEGHLSPVKEARIGLDLYFINDHAFPGTYSSAKVYTIGVDGSIKVGEPLTLSAFAFYQTGKAKNVAAGLSTGTDLKIQGYAADVRVDLAAGPGKGFIEAIYISGDDPNTADDKFKGITTGSTYALAASFYASTDMEILLPNIADINTSEALTYDAANLGLGLFHVGAGFTMPLMDKLTGKVGLGHSRFVKAGNDADSFASTGIPGGKTMGTEINAKLTLNLAKGLDLSGIAAYALLGDAYDPAPGVVGVSSPDDLWKALARLNYAF